MKGQVKIEFVLGAVIFAVIIFYVASQINTAFLSAVSDSRIDSLKAESITVLELLAKDSERGLAYPNQPNRLNRTRIDEWETNKGANNNCMQLNELDLGGYRLVISHETDGVVLRCGFVGISTIRTSVVRPVKIGNAYGNMTLEMW